MPSSRLLTVLRRNIWRILVAALVCGATSASIVKDLPQKYTAIAQVVIDINASTSGDGADLSPFIVDKYIATQVDIMSSQAVALRVVDRLGLAAVTTARDAGHAVPAAPVKALRETLATELREVVDVKPGRDSSVITITAVATDAALARDLANTWAREYLAESIDMRVNPARQASAFLRAEAESLRKSSEAAQQRVAAFQQQHGLTAADESLDAENIRLGELATELSRIEALRIDTSNRRIVAEEASRRAAGVDLPAVQEDRLIQQLRARLAALDGRRKERAAVLAANHPEIRQLNEEVAAAQSQLQQATAALTRGITLSQRMTTQREAELLEAVERQRRKVLDLRGLRDQWAVLQQDQEAARQAYEKLRQRLTAQTIESRSQLTSASLLSEAALPQKPSVLLSVLKVVASALLAGVLTAGIAVAWDLWAPRVQGRRDLEEVVADGPVVFVRKASRRHFRHPRLPGSTQGGRRLGIGLSGNG